MRSLDSYRVCSAFLMFSAVVLAIQLFAPEAAAQGPFTKEMVIAGDTGLKWVNTGITVAAGDTVRLAAAGQVDVGSTWGIHGPEGTTNFSEQPRGYYPLESRRRYGLAARITLGSARKYLATQTWAYSDAREMKITRSGILWLTVNDDAPEGNTGDFTVKITVLKRYQ